MSPEVLPVKDGERESPVAQAWRAAFRLIAQSLRDGDFALSQLDLNGMSCAVDPVDARTASHMKAYVIDYGETLAGLSEDTWKSSVAQWVGHHWDVIVDLWTVESGRSDMVIAARVFEAGNDSFRIVIDSVHVP